LVENVVMA